MNKHFYSWQDVEQMCTDIVLQMYKDLWRPDYIVGLTRGGNIPATIISHMIDVPCETLKVSLRDGGQCESNCWMSEDAFGYVALEEQELYKSRWDPARRSNILIVDDINDTGATLEWIEKDWRSSCLPNEDAGWSNVFGGNVRFAVLTNNLSSNFDNISYYSHEVNKIENDVWLVYPWEKK